MQEKGPLMYATDPANPNPGTICHSCAFNGRREMSAIEVGPLAISAG